MPDRLQKILAAAGLGSRRKCEQWIREGRVSVDGQVVIELGTCADPATQRVALDGRVIPKTPVRRVYIALNKPRGYASTLADSHAARLLTDLIDLPGKPMLRPVGRLDIESEGLILLSDDGDFIYRITHPKFQIAKTYVATVRGKPSPENLELMRTGVRLDDGTSAKADRVRLTGTFPATDTSDIELTVHEGRNRMIRRMCAGIGHPTLRLVRTRIAFLTNGSIPSGGWRHLTASEVQRLMKGPVEETVSAVAQPHPNGARPSEPRRAVRTRGIAL
jgi:23S rRNA pseudouridine2605 synthase